MREKNQAVFEAVDSRLYFLFLLVILKKFVVKCLFR